MDKFYNKKKNLSNDCKAYRRLLMNLARSNSNYYYQYSINIKLVLKITIKYLKTLNIA